VLLISDLFRERLFRPLKRYPGGVYFVRSLHAKVNLSILQRLSYLSQTNASAMITHKIPKKIQVLSLKCNRESEMELYEYLLFLTFGAY
jgi:hypothetical protein